MAITHIAVLAMALVALLCLPCAVVVVVCADAMPARRPWSRGGRRDVHALRCLDRRLSSTEPFELPAASQPGIDELTADLRRLARQRTSGPTRESAAWLAAVVRAYDHRLVVVSEALGVPHHLTGLDGMDRDLERIRLEEKLRAAGLRLR
ncbi:hypothetical protein AB0J80_10765 [Actinoplanes sp. NPDC049548]|uniref:hypothetical protein n=1 Tax=Actinoplanes sp. NPDC049548 TaxID=3155152 RepID=UPI003422CD96